jgi:hypothetical protein
MAELHLKLITASFGSAWREAWSSRRFDKVKQCRAHRDRGLAAALCFFRARHRMVTMRRQELPIRIQPGLERRALRRFCRLSTAAECERCSSDLKIPGADADAARSEPPATLFGFYWHFARQAKWLFAMLFVAGFVVACSTPPSRSSWAAWSR